MKVTMATAFREHRESSSDWNTGKCTILGVHMWEAWVDKARNQESRVQENITGLGHRDTIGLAKREATGV